MLSGLQAATGVDTHDNKCPLRGSLGRSEHAMACGQDNMGQGKAHSSQAGTRTCIDRLAVRGTNLLYVSCAAAWLVTLLQAGFRSQ